MSWSFERAHRELRTARDPYIGKPIANNTRLILNGEIESPTSIALRHHRTNIITFYPDGRKRFVLWDSMSTKMRLREYGGVHCFNHRLPTFNGRRPYCEKVAAFRANRNGDIVAGSNVVELQANDEWNLDSITPERIEFISDAKAVRAAQKKMRVLCTQLEVRRKLGCTPTYRRPGDWLLEHLDQPLDQIDWKTASNWSGSYLELVPQLSWPVAQHIGATTKLQLKILPTSAVAI